MLSSKSLFQYANESEQIDSELVIMRGANLNIYQHDIQ
jgi:hypothetical protein